jgi:NAD(P)-dependent dehydrogenase (short-subunit alcohol dehydrogenase family)
MIARIDVPMRGKSTIMSECTARISRVVTLDEIERDQKPLWDSKVDGFRILRLNQVECVYRGACNASRVVSFLVSPRAGYITGSNIRLDSGMLPTT